MMVSVFVRIRPTANFARELIECLPDGQTLNIHHRKDFRKSQDSKHNRSGWSFPLEGVLQDVSQHEVYTRVCRRVVLGAMDGYNGSVMCFGQTGSGKTYTMTGSTESYKQRGVIPRAIQEVFREVEKRPEHAFSVRLSYLEIYNETLVDLLSSLKGPAQPCARGLVVTEGPARGVLIRGLSLHLVHSEEEALNLLFEGDMNRCIGCHSLNRVSSRSHCIFTVHLECRSRTLSDAKYVTSKLNLVDLAGSERVEKTRSEGQMLKEAVYINKSLSFLEQAIVALADRHRDHVPFRQTKLTHVLKDSLGGNCNTVLVANIYGEAAQIEETLSTLRFASRMKCVRAEPTVNEHIDPAAQIKKLEKEIMLLKEELSVCKLGKPPPVRGNMLTEAQLAEIHNQVQKYLKGSLQEINIANMKHIPVVFSQFKQVVQEQEQKLKAKLSQPSTVVVKDQCAHIAPAKEKDTRANSDEAEASGQRPSSTKAKTTPKNIPKSWDKQSKSLPAEISPVSRKRAESASRYKPSSAPNSERDADTDTDTQGTHSHAHEHFPLSTPPPRADAFEDFKAGRGSSINRILKENKAVLLERRSLLRQLGEEVNSVKREIDGITATMQQNEARGAQGQYLVLEGKPVLQEPDASLLKQLQKLKEVYRQRYEVLHDIKAEVNYCQHLVDGCRVRLLSEFENWYKKCFLIPEEEEEEDLSLEKSPTHSAERLHLDSHSSESFYNARCKALKRSKAKVSMSPLQRNLSVVSGQRRFYPLPK